MPPQPFCLSFRHSLLLTLPYWTFDHGSPTVTSRQYAWNGVLLTFAHDGFELWLSKSLLLSSWYYSCEPPCPACSFPSIPKWKSIVWLRWNYILLFFFKTHYRISGQLVCFQFGAITNKVTVHIYVQLFLWTFILVFVFKN
jgi:hypothetical protein